MQHDAVETYHWMTDSQFLNAVALGQVTPGPVVHTVAVVGYAAAGLGGGLLAAAGRLRAVVLVRPDRRRALRPPAREPDACRPSSTAPARPRSGRSPAPRCPLALALSERWQFAILAASAIAVFALRRGIVATLVAAGAAGALAAIAGAPLPG